jgi:type III pantothenate kinase
MLLAVDIGNTTIALGVFRGRTFAADWRIKTDKDKTGDEYGVLLLSLFRRAGIRTDRIGAVIISSVVPPLTPIFQAVSEDLFGKKALVVGPGLRTGMPILYENPLEVGADRVVASIAAFEKYGGPCVVVDFGTATTFDAVSAKGEYLGGAIAPGIQISAEALYLKTARLPRIEIRKPKKAIGRTTVASMQSGLYFGYVGLVVHTIAQIGKELGRGFHVVATGGFGAQIAAEIPAIEAYEPSLVLEGLRVVYERNQDE